MSNDSPENARTLARKPRGLADRNAADIAATEAMMAKIRAVYHRYGFDAVETPFLEYTDALGKFLPDQDRPNAGVFSLRDDDEQWMSLRYDLTAPLARYVAENWQNLPKPYRSYRAGWVFRNEKPGPGRFRQFMQFDADTVGASSVAADAEMCMMAADTLEALGIPRGQYVIKVNNRKILDGVMDAIDLGGEENAARRLIVLRAIDKLDKFGWTEVEKLLGPGRRDESGDFTAGAGLADLQISVLASVFGAPSDQLRKAMGNFPLLSMFSIADESAFSGRNVDDMESIEFEGKTVFIDNFKTISTIASRVLGSEEALSGCSELRTMNAIFEACGYGSKRIIVDTAVVRGLEYYTGPVFEANLNFAIDEADGQTVSFGSVGGGGRYDGLVSRFLDEKVPATGFSIGVSRLLAALQALGKVSAEPEPGPVIVLAMDRTPEAMASTQKIVADLRNSGIRAELYLGDAGMKAQLKYADRRNAAVAIIQGSNEREKEYFNSVTGEKEVGEAQVKDLILGATLSGIKDRAEYLARQAEAQVTVPVSGVLEAVRKVLERHGR
jgi:histidyl-tRNA synthetase